LQVVDKARYSPNDNSLQREVEVLNQVQHENCIRLKSCYVTPRKVYIVTELVTGGELLDRVTEKGYYTEHDAANIISQILAGVNYLHSRGIVHRDLKLENLVLSDPSDSALVKIADFGLSKYFTNGSMLQTMCGSPQYVAPEILDVGIVTQAYSPAVDMWSVGVILYILLSGYSPFDDDNDAVLFEKIRCGEYSLEDPVWSEVSEDAKSLLAQLLCVNSEERISASDALRHPWLLAQVGSNYTDSAPSLSKAQSSMHHIVEKRNSWRRDTLNAIQECKINEDQ